MNAPIRNEWDNGRQRRAARDIWRTAESLVEEAGAGAPACASRWARELLDAGDVKARAEWMRVMVACEVILAQRNRPSA